MPDQEDQRALAESSPKVPATDGASASQVPEAAAAETSHKGADVKDVREVIQPSMLPAIPNQHNLPTPVDYDKLLMLSDDEDVYTQGSNNNDYNIAEDSTDASNLPSDSVSHLPSSSVKDDATNDDSNFMADVMNTSVTSNFTDKFFPPSPARANVPPSPIRAKNDVEAGSTDLGAPLLGDFENNGDPDVDAPVRSLDVAPSPSAPLALPTPSSTLIMRGGPPMEILQKVGYRTDDDDDDDDISTLANETIIPKYMMSGIQLSRPEEIKPGRHDNSDGASQLSELKAPKRGEEKDTDEEENTTEPPSPSKSSMFGEDGSKSADVSTLGSRSVWSGRSRRLTKKQCLYVVGLTCVMLAIIGSLVYAFSAIKAKQNELTAASQQQNPGSEGDDDVQTIVILEPTPAPTPLGPTTDPSVHPTMSPSRSAAPTLRPTRNPTGIPSRRPTAAPSVAPTLSPTLTSSTSPTIAPTLTPTWTPGSIMRQLLRDVDVTFGKTLQAIEIPSSPQGQAFDWLIQDPNFANYEDFRKLQRFALACLYYSVATPGDSQGVLDSWLNYDTDECTWFLSWYENRTGCGSDGIFKFLTLKNINLVGTIPPELMLLTRLVSLVLRDNALMGTIPSEFREWQSLENLDLRGNFLSGPIPDFNNANDLKRIDLSWNQITGTIPDGVASLNQLEYVDFTENFIYGSVPTQLCTRSLQSLGVDCLEVSCGCCDKCGSEETRFPVESPPRSPTRPPTPFPTPIPTPPPTPIPTPPPTPGPTDSPSSSPTNIPSSSPTLFPTMSPTPCSNAIQAAKNCFSFGEPIVINYNNCNPVGDSWIGIYPDGIVTGQHGDPLLWKNSCNSKSCFQAIVRGSVIMDADSAQASSFPLAEGEYKAWLFNERVLGGPHPAIIGTTKFFVGFGQC